MIEASDAQVPTRLHSLHWVVLGFSFAVTIFAWYFTSAQMHENLTSGFERESQKLAAMIQERMQKYEVALWAGVGLIDALGPERALTAEQWQRFAEDINLPGQYPGVDGIGVIYRQPGQASPSSQNTDAFRITFIEPVEPNAKDLGRDLALDDQAYAAISRAAAEGKVQVSGPVARLRQQTVEPGFLFLAPFFHDRDGARSLGNLRGVIYQPFTIGKLIAGVTAPEHRGVTFTLRDEETVLYSEDHNNAAGYDPYPMFNMRLRLPLYGREWVLDIQSNLRSRQSAVAVQPVTILLIGLTVNGLLVAIFVMLVRANARASKLATKVTDDLQQSQIALQDRNEELIQFNYRVSHDLVAPLRTVLGLVRMIQEDVDDGDLDEVPQELAKVDELIQVQLGLITNIFNLCKADQGNEAFSVVALAPMVDEVFAEQLSTHDGAVVTMSVDLGSCPAVIAQPNRLRQVLSNLISNAIKYRDESREECFIEISSSVGANGVILRVGDNGIGIPAELQSKVFDLFFRAHSRVADGAGLGTYIVKKHIENMGGRVRLFSDESGTCFELELPEYQQQGDPT